MKTGRACLTHVSSRSEWDKISQKKTKEKKERTASLKEKRKEETKKRKGKTIAGFSVE